jgi:hypothetical protein
MEPDAATAGEVDQQQHEHGRTERGLTNPQDLTAGRADSVAATPDDDTVQPEYGTPCDEWPMNPDGPTLGGVDQRQHRHQGHEGQGVNPQERRGAEFAGRHGCPNGAVVSADD